MPKSRDQKLKILYLKKILCEQTDEEHPLSLADIMAQLALYDISAERKSLYNDIEALKKYGLDIIMVKNPIARYYVANRDFELPELKLLVDIVQANHFLTQKKTRTLIKKLAALGSKYEGELIKRQVYIANRIKTMNESILYNVDEIYNGISAKKKITFLYYEINANKRKVYRHNGKTYKVSPFALTLSGENYYLVAYDTEQAKIKHFRVDKMEKICVADERRDGEDKYKNIDIAEYTNKTFGMAAKNVM